MVITRYSLDNDLSRQVGPDSISVIRKIKADFRFHKIDLARVKARLVVGERLITSGAHALHYMSELKQPSLRCGFCEFLWHRLDSYRGAKDVGYRVP